MSHKIQITVDTQLNNVIKLQAQRAGLSVSSYARLVLIGGLTKRNTGLLDQALQDINSGRVDALSLQNFEDQLDEL